MTEQRTATDAETLIQNNLGLVYAVARQRFYRLRHDEDLIQCGMAGLCAAAKCWAGKGAFVSYASACIRNEMSNYVRGNKRWNRIHAGVPFEEAMDQRQAAPPDERIANQIDTTNRIKRYWPKGSKQRYILLSLAAGRSKQELGRRLGIRAEYITTIAKRAVDKMGGPIP